MRIVIQRSGKSKVDVDGHTVGSIDQGLVLLVCCEKGDSPESLEKAFLKIINLRTFENPQTGRFDLNIEQVNGSLLVISQFTLSWRGEKGNRPGWDRAMAPDDAKKMFDSFCRKFVDRGIPLEKGEFGAKMEVNILNLGPVTYCLDF